VVDSRFRSECLNNHRYLRLADAQEKIEDYLGFFDEACLNEAIGNESLILLQNSGGAVSPSP
jgi:putative transposase